MNVEIKRPRGVKIYLVLGILDAIVMAGFLVFFFSAPELYSTIFNEEEFGQEYATIKFDEKILEFGLFVIAVDILGIIGLLSVKPSGRKLVIGCAVAGVVFNVIIFGIPGLIANSILVWYMFRKSTKEYFESKIQLN